MNKKIYFIIIIAMAMAKGSFLLPLDSSSSREQIVATLEKERNEIKQTIKQAKKNNVPHGDWLAKDLAIYLTHRCIENHPLVTEENTTECFTKSFDFIARENPAYYTDMENKLFKKSKMEGSAALQQK